jgi:hypothetical protein
MYIFIISAQPVRNISYFLRTATRLAVIHNLKFDTDIYLYLWVVFMEYSMHLIENFH